jgi:hypothetical protein
VGQRISGIQPDRLIKESDGFAIVINITALKIEMSLEVSVMRFHAVGRGARSDRILGPEQGQFQ